MDLTWLTIADLLGIGGSAVVVMALMEIGKRALAVTDEQIKRWGPLVAAILGILVSGSAALYLHAEIAQAALTGFGGGLMAGGLYDLVKPLLEKMGVAHTP